MTHPIFHSFELVRSERNSRDIGIEKMKYLKFFSRNLPNFISLTLVEIVTNFVRNKFFHFISIVLEIILERFLANVLQNTRPAGRTK